MIGDNLEGNTGHPVTVVNDTRQKKEVKIVIKDHDTKRKLVNKTVSVEANGKIVLDELPVVNTNQLWLIEYVIDGRTFNNHYVAYNPPMKFEVYKEWLPALRR